MKGFCAVQRLAGGRGIPGVSHSWSEPEPGMPLPGVHSPGQSLTALTRQEKPKGTAEEGGGVTPSCLAHTEEGPGLAAEPWHRLCTGSCSPEYRNGETCFPFAPFPWQKVLPVTTEGKAISDRNGIYSLEVSLLACKFLATGIMVFI